MQTSLTNLDDEIYHGTRIRPSILFLPPRTSSTLVRPSKYLVLTLTSYQIPYLYQISSSLRSSSFLSLHLHSIRGEKVARREACSIVVRQHYSRSRYARGVEPSFKRPPSIRRQHRYDYVSNGRSVGREKHDSTRDFSGCERSFSSTTMIERVFHPSMTRLPREIDVISRGLCVSLLHCWNEST